MKLIKESSWILFLSTITETFAFITNFGIIYILSNIFSPSEYAYYSLSITFYGFFFLFTNFGIGWTVLRHVSANTNNNTKKKAELISQGFTYSFLFGLLFSALLFFLSSYFEIIYDMPHLGINLKYISIYLFFSNLILYIENAFQGLKNFKFYAISNISFNSLKLCVVLLVFIMDIDITAILGLITLCSMIQFLLIFLIVQFNNNYFNYITKFDKKTFNIILKFSIYVFIPGLFLFVYTKFNQFLLAFYTTPDDFSFYSITLVLIEGFSLPILILSRATFPYVTNYSENDKDNSNISLMYNFLIKYGLLISIPISVCFFYFSDNLIILIFTSKYLPASNYLKVYIFYLNIKMLGLNGANFLYASNKSKMVFKLTGITALVSFIMSIILIPFFYSYGAIFSVIIPHIVYIIYTILHVKKDNNIVLKSHIFITILKYLLSSIISLILVNILIMIFRLDLMNVINYLLIIILYYTSFFVLIIIIKGISIKEIKNLIFNISVKRKKVN
ncbi:MAG: oligosaccharide flippase family protein [Promethearchaeota archaeon]